MENRAVYLATNSNGPAAVKIFDDELIARYGDKVQLARIDRELTLVGQSHPNVVQILAGGVDAITGNHFIVMEYLNGQNLKDSLADIPVDSIQSLIQQLAFAAKFLEDQGLAHRDIKPENVVVIDNFRKLVLLDLGVLRPFAGSDITDANGIQSFVGTLQYSSPEFLLRQEEDSLEGWRALTFYQIGGVLHDLIMRRPLLAEFSEPYARLVNAVQFVAPEIKNSAVPYHLVELARWCLVKDWRIRNTLVKWSSFDPPKQPESRGESARQRVANRGMLAKAQQAKEPDAPQQAYEFDKNALIREVQDFLAAAARTIRSAETSVLPPLRILARTPDDASFGIELGKAAQLGWNTNLTVFVSVEILDLQTKLIVVTGCGCMGNDRHGENLGRVPTTIFRGTYDAAALSSALENCIYDLVDQVQQTQGVIEDSHWLSTAEEAT